MLIDEVRLDELPPNLRKFGFHFALDLIDRIHECLDIFHRARMNLVAQHHFIGADLKRDQTKKSTAHNVLRNSLLKRGLKISLRRFADDQRFDFNGQKNRDDNEN